MTRPRLDLEIYLPYLLNRAGSRIAVAFSAVVRDYGISLQTWRVLAALNQHEGQRIGDLAATTSIETSTLSRVIDAMVRKRLVERRRSADDARTVTVRRTYAGAALTDRVIPIARHYEDVALTGFSDEEAEVLRAMLRRLYDNMGVLEDEQRSAGAATE